VYDVHPSLKTRFTALNFTGAAALWLQTMERRERIAYWDRLCQLVFEKFDRDQYPLLLKQFSGLKQTGSVVEYQAEFEKMPHAILLYNPAYDDTYFITQFVLGLREDIRSAIVLHRPQDVVTASSLALLQEEELSHLKQRPPTRDSGRFVPKQYGDRVKPADADKAKPPLNRAEADDKLSVLKEYRRKNGLCYKCGEKWSHHHTCPDKESLHVIEELWDALTPVDPREDCVDGDAAEEIISVVSSETPGVQKRLRTMKLCGWVGKQEVLVLVDSGSVATFISDRLVRQLNLETVPTEPIKFLAADGSPMICASRVPNLHWSAQKHTFISDAGVIPLKCFDMLLGEDWLEECRPMWIDWVQKIMRFTLNGKRITLQGIKPTVSDCTPICSIQLKGLLRRGAVS
jgi:hypothetical protein